MPGTPFSYLLLAASTKDANQVRSINLPPCVASFAASQVSSINSPPCVASEERGNTSRRREMTLVVLCMFVVNGITYRYVTSGLNSVCTVELWESPPNIPNNQ